MARKSFSRVSSVFYVAPFPFPCWSAMVLPPSPLVTYHPNPTQYSLIIPPFPHSLKRCLYSILPHFTARARWCFPFSTTTQHYHLSSSPSLTHSLSRVACLPFCPISLLKRDGAPPFLLQPCTITYQPNPT